MAEPSIIIIKKKSGHAGHHGGAWKVAYADFVTAMMALFIVLWLLSSSKPVQEAVGGYFRDPNGTAQKKGVGVSDVGAKEKSPPAALKKEDMPKLKEELTKSLEKMAGFDKLKKQIEITVTSEGLRIEVMEDPKGTFFERGSAKPTPILQDLLRVLSVEVGKLPNRISIEGHTDAKPFSDSKLYGNWELSADRANIARRLMQTSGIRADQVSQVRGFADQSLRKPLLPEDASNRRITVIVQYADPVAASAGKEAAALGKEAAIPGKEAPGEEAAIPGKEAPGGKEAVPAAKDAAAAAKAVEPAAEAAVPAKSQPVAAKK